uniref:Uncharacterized protein n=1 Tax=Vespula pensylvanica TaxID=30213 RepID=A0A834UHZ2_VESPE|nr:hypothetical protein H0235_001773 [Vespula pensylvanica]
MGLSSHETKNNGRGQSSGKDGLLERHGVIALCSKSTFGTRFLEHLLCLTSNDTQNSVKFGDLGFTIIIGGNRDYMHVSLASGLCLERWFSCIVPTYFWIS